MRIAIVGLTLIASTALAQHDSSDDLKPMRPRHYESGMPMALGDRAARLAAAVKTGVIGWTLEGVGYELTCDEVSSNCGVMLLRSQAWRKGTAGAFLHRESALPWRGARVELRAKLRTGSVEQHASLVIIAQDEAGKTLRTARSEPLKGTSSFAWRSVALEVPAEAERLIVGFELAGRGAVYLREIQFDDAELLAAR